MAVDSETVTKLMGMLMPYAAEQRLKLLKDPRLAYYTTVDVAEKLIRNQEIWLRDCTLMNDSMEVRHGIQLIDDYFAMEENRAALADALGAHSDVALAVLKMFDEWKTDRSLETYLMSLSRHAPPDVPRAKEEDKHGRLSMWRGYGGPEGVALVFNIPSGSVEGFNMFFSPVAYLDKIDAQMDAVTQKLKKEHQFLSVVPRDLLVNGLFLTLVMAAVSLKHPGFHEEAEWRLLYMPSTYRSTFVTPHLEYPRAKAENVFKTTLPRLTNGGLAGMDLATLIDRVIIGPTTSPGLLKERVVKALSDMGITNPDKRVHISGIPYRFNT